MGNAYPAIERRLVGNERDILLIGAKGLFPQMEGQTDKERVKAIVDFVEPFVLPAIECDKSDGEVEDPFV